MADARYTIGIDLGTSNCAVAFSPLQGPKQGQVIDFPVLQLQGLGELNSLPLLPSTVYLPSKPELASGGFELPWPSTQTLAIGEFARRQGSRVPGRLISSAKSWLCHPGVDRNAAILPWSAPPDVPRLSPVKASSLLLEHMRKAWNHKHPEAPLEEQEVVITVPASFDEVARALTANAAKEAGIERFTLLEEPQAAFYDFSARHRTNLERLLESIRLILVVDIGGGTSDFTLVQAAFTGSTAALRRIAVGDHLMLGGDNMDAALAHHLEQGWLKTNRKLSGAQFGQLVQAARAAKETLLGENAPDRSTVAIASESSKLLGSTLTATLQRAEAEGLILDGFFPFSSAEDAPQRTRLAIQEMGLPYVSDPAISRHIAAFLRKHAAAGWVALGEPGGTHGNFALPRPDAILLNGGVFNSPKIAARAIEVVSSWWPGQGQIKQLEHDSLDLAVARGAAYYGLVRHGLGQRIGGGAARAYYVGLASKKEEKNALCLIPRGFEEGEKIELKERAFQLTLGKPVQFPLYSTTEDRVDRPGDVIPVTEELQALPPIQTVLKSARQKVERLPVHLHARLTEIGTLELWCAPVEGTDRWRLEFDLRGGPEQPAEMTTTEAMPARFGEARLFIELFYGNKPPVLPASAHSMVPKEVKHLWTALERVLGPRESWPLPVLRELSTVLLAGIGRRRRTAEHEKVFCQLLGYSLRPGFGYSLDEWRCEQAAKIFPELIQFHKEKPNWNEYWILWRRISGGLKPEVQNAIWDYFRPHLAARVPLESQKAGARAKGPQAEGFEEMLRAAASLEHVSASEKVWLGELILERLENSKGGPWLWALGRLGARRPLYGSSHNVVPQEIAAAWVKKLLPMAEKQLHGATFAITQISRRTNDRALDLDEALRTKVLTLLASLDASPTWRLIVAEAQHLEAADEARAFGDSLPAGLQL